MAQPYYDTIQLIERLHRHFLDVLKLEIDRLGIQDANNVQALILYNIGEDELTVGELTMRGYYLGSNVSYNVKRMVENGYLVQERSIHDRRSVRVKLSRKGLVLRDRVSALFERQVAGMRNVGVDMQELGRTTETLAKIERFWSAQMEYGGLALATAA